VWEEFAHNGPQQQFNARKPGYEKQSELQYIITVAKTAIGSAFSSMSTRIAICSIVEELTVNTWMTLTKKNSEK
jgi:hypothetical protein